ncbi:MAG: protein kinase [Anaerolineae bacterium]|nr:protein kinase [Anaerolineae bacterium]
MENNSLVNTRLGKYLIQSELGRGGMAAVYLGYDPTLERTVAIKVLAPHLVWQKDFVDRFLREARSAARLRHPNIVTIFDVGQESGWYYFVMEYLEGKELTEYIKEQGALPPEEVITILRPLAEALDYAHEQGLIHRDIKPGNIIIDQGHSKITDFGIARASHETRLTSTGTIIGTPEYMSPEQAQGLTVDARSDQYSLAVVAYEMLSGIVPFQADSTMAVLYKVTHEPPPPISDVKSDLPKGVETVLEQAMAKEPEARFENVAAFINALEDALAGKKVKRSKKVKTPQPKKKRKGVPVWLWILGFIALLALIGGGLWSQGILPIPNRQIAGITPTPSQTPSPTNTPDMQATNAAGTVIAAAQTIGAPTNTPTPTATPTRTPKATSTSSTGTETATPTATPKATNTPDPNATPTRTPEPTTPSPTPTAAPTSSNTNPSNALITFDPMGTWRRGDQANGEFTQSQEQAHTGTYSGKLTYTFPSSGDDYVVFMRSIGLSGKPNSFGAWVYGDGSGHFLNIWVQDAQNEVWAINLGKVGSPGWKQMTGVLDINAGWPNGHVSGPDNGVIDYPVRFYALVLDRPDVGPLSGKIYIDDISVWTGNITTPPPTQETGVQPTTPPETKETPTTAPPPTGDVGHIVFTVQADNATYLYSTDPAWSQMSIIGPSDSKHSTCAGSTVTTLEGQTLNLYGVRKCNITSSVDVCPSPDGVYNVIVQRPAGDYQVVLVRISDNTIVEGYYVGPLNPNPGIIWAPDSSHFLFTIGNTVHKATVGTPGYQQVIPEISDIWPPQYTADGTALFYMKPVGSEGATDIFIINLDGTNMRNLTNSPSTQKSCPRWNP